MLDSLKDGLQRAVKKLMGSSIVDEYTIKEFVRELQRTLIQADVNVRLVLGLTERVQKRAMEEKPPSGITRKDQLVTILFEELSSLLGGDYKFSLERDKVKTIIMFGIQGSGKTTTTAKLAHFFTRRGFRVGVIAADTFRPAAATQLKTLCEPIGVQVYSNELEKDPVKIATQGKKYFETNKDVILIDTAGRHKEEKGLLQEMKSIVDVIKPDLNILVVDGTIGQRCYDQALAFHEVSPIGGIIVTKLDGAAKGGGALAAVAATGARILFIGTGERIDDLEEFSPTRFVGRLLGMGDLKALLEMVKQSQVEVEEERAKRIISGKITMDDLLYQFEQIKRLGSLKKVFEHIPGISGMLKSEDLDTIEDKIKVYKSIIQSMTKEEKENPEKLNASRIKRIAYGSGRTEKDVRELLLRYKQAKGLMKVGKTREFRQLMKRMGTT